MEKSYFKFLLLCAFLILPLGCSHPPHEHYHLSHKGHQYCSICHEYHNPRHEHFKPHAGEPVVVSGPVPAQPVGVRKTYKHYCTTCGTYYNPKYHCRVCGSYYHGKHHHVCG